MLALLDAVVDGSNPQDEVNDCFPGDDLFTPLGRRRGLPSGNLTGHWFADWYLDGFDHPVTRGSRSGRVRYCDDFVIFGDRQRLIDLRHRMDELLADLRLRAHPRRHHLRRLPDVGTPARGARRPRPPRLETLPAVEEACGR